MSHAHGGGVTLDAILLAVALLAIVVYLGGVVSSARRGRTWPVHRALCWVAGVGCAAAAVAGPLAAASATDFVMHMWGHLLAGMIAPLLLVLAAPVTLALRTLNVTPARRLSRMLRSAPVRIVAHPVTAAVLSAGGCGSSTSRRSSNGCSTIRSSTSSCTHTSSRSGSSSPRPCSASIPGRIRRRKR